MPSGRLWLATGDRIETADNSYVVIHRLGEGGSSVAFLAICESGMLAGMTVAIKAFDRLDDDVRLRHFEAEGKMLSELNHSSILQVLDRGFVIRMFREAPVFYPILVTRAYADTLERIVVTRASLQLRLVYAMQLLSAVRYLARLRNPIIHRDIKPRNIYVDGTACVLADFGVFTTETDLRVHADDPAFRVASSRTIAKHYKPPEFAAFAEDGTPPTASANVYQLGLVFFRMFLGVAAPDGEIEDHHIRSIPGRFRSNIGAIIQAMTDRDPGSRATPDDALEVCAEVAAGLMMENFSLNGRTW